MKPSRIFIGLGAIFLVVVAILLSGKESSDKESKSVQASEQTAPKGALQIEFAYSPEKEPLVANLVKQYNAKKQIVNGKTTYVHAVSIASGEAQRKIAKGTYQPTVWSPAGSLWGRLLNYEADKPFVPEQNKSIVNTPLVIAMWKKQAEALGWPKKKIGFSELQKLATDSQGWGAVGHPEYGDFKLVHTNPDFSTAGLEATVAEYYAATGKKEGLLQSDISGSARQKVKQLENSIIHYGDTTLFVADQLVKSGPSYASAAIVEEATLVDINQRLQGEKMVAIYPKEGTFFSDSPFIVLNAPWVNNDQKAAAKEFEKFLNKNISVQSAAQSGFRVADTDKHPVAPINVANGMDPKQPTRILGLPEPKVLAQIKEAWQEDRRPANVMMVLDVSGSMAQENRLVRAKTGLNEFLKGVGKQDRLGLTVFNEEQKVVAPLGTSRKQIKTYVDGLTADGGTTIFDTTQSAFQYMRNQKDDGKINAIVLLTDGEDTDSASNLQKTIEILRSQGDSKNHVRIFTIAYTAGAEGAQKGLSQIAAATDGKFYQGNTSDIESVYKSISSFF